MPGVLGRGPGRRPVSGLILGPVIAVADAIGRGQWDWWIVAVLVVAVLVAQVVAVVTRGPLGKEGDSDER